MREVLFRGKCKRNAWSDGGQWLYGDYLRCGDGAQIWVHEDGDENNYEVDPETVGQWTGLTDCKGVRIFEGDLIRHQGVIYRVRYLSDMTRFAAVRPNGTFEPAALADCEVIGNIYDNPGLMEE